MPAPAAPAFLPALAVPATRPPARAMGQRHATPTASTPPPSPSPSRREAALAIRRAAAALAAARPFPAHHTSVDAHNLRDPSTALPSHLATFSKGLPHSPLTGLPSPPAIHALLTALSLPPALAAPALTALPPPPPFRSAIASTPPAGHRPLANPTAGLAFDLQGPDPAANTLPPPPPLASPELALELAELYWMALLRDVPFTLFPTSPLVAAAAASLSRFPPPSPARARPLPLAPATLFRGPSPAELPGPYISQFLLAGTAGLSSANAPADGFVQYGATRIDQRVRVAAPARDYMTTFAAWLDVQNGASVLGRELYTNTPTAFRFITTPRDLATHVHFDAVYQAYLVAALILLDLSAPLDPGLPFQSPAANQQGFVTFGPAQILALVAEVSTRALKAVWFQKWNVHRRLRPEALAGLLDRRVALPDEPALAGLQPLLDALRRDGGGLLELVAEENARQNDALSDGGVPRREDLADGEDGRRVLLPMAYAEGSPMHPAYGAGHAAVAGACVTVLKAFFDAGFVLPFAFVPSEDGSRLEEVGDVKGKLTVEGELNKLCSNMSIGRNWAGVHYYSDYIEAIRLGETVAIQLMEEQKLTFGESFSMTIPLFDGDVRRL